MEVELAQIERQRRELGYRNRRSLITRHEAKEVYWGLFAILMVIALATYAVGQHNVVLAFVTVFSFVLFPAFFVFIAEHGMC